MKRSKSTRRRTPEAGADDRRKTYKGHEVLIPADERRRRIYIDGRPVQYGLAGDTYYLDVYAYDPAKSLDEVIERYLDYKERTERRKKEK